MNKDSKGIAVFDPKGRRNTLKYYFDVSDTHEGYYGSRPVPIWQMDKRYEQPVIAQLETAKVEVEKPFAFENELKEKTERLNALNIELNLNEKDNSVIDDEPEQNDEQPEKKSTDRER